MFTNYELWYGQLLNDSQPKSIMKRIDDPLPYTFGSNYEFRVVAADMDHHRDFGPNWVWGSHPDRQPGFLRLLNASSSYTPNYHATYRHHRTNYENPHLDMHADIDRNFLYDDGAVRRITGIGFSDSRFVRLPAVRWLATSGFHLYLPKDDI
jgi:hypothetical protein